MFEIGFSEMLLIGVVALVVLGPERLPKAARFVGLWVRRVRAYWFNMRAELERELAAEEMKKHLEEARAALREAEARMAETTGEATAALSGPTEAAVADGNEGGDVDASPSASGHAGEDAHATQEAASAASHAEGHPKDVVDVEAARLTLPASSAAAASPTGTRPA